MEIISGFIFAWFLSPAGGSSNGLGIIPEAKAALPAHLTTPKSDPRASAVEKDNPFISVHWPGEPLGCRSAVATSFVQPGE